MNGVPVRRRPLLLFDIDGTLVRGGPARGAFETAMVEVFGTAGPIDDHEFSGKTDPQIARELLRLADFEEADIEGGFEALWGIYLAELEARLPARPTVALPGVMELLRQLRDMEEVALGLVTGNVQRGAHLKLEAASIRAAWFPVGAFGSDHEHRNELPGVAIQRASAHWGGAWRPEDVVVIGDTPRDVACGQAHGARTVAVATGKVSREQLEAAGPDALLESFADVELTVSTILDG